MNCVQSYGIAYNVSMKGGSQDVLSKIHKANKIVVLDKFLKEVKPLMDESGEKLDLNKLSDKDLAFLFWVKKKVVEKYSKGIETLEGLKNFFSTDIGLRPPLLYNEKNGVYNGVKVVIGTPVKKRRKYIVTIAENEFVGKKYIVTTAKNECEASKELGLKTKETFFDRVHYREFVDSEGRVLRRDSFKWDDDKKVMFWIEKRIFKPIDSVRPYDVDKDKLPVNEQWDKELINEYNYRMRYPGEVNPDIVAELRKRGIIPKNQKPKYIWGVYPQQLGCFPLHKFYM